MSNTNKLYIDPNTVTLVRHIGMGGFGSISEVRWKEAPAAMKTVHINENVQQLIEREVAILEYVQALLKSDTY